MKPQGLFKKYALRHADGTPVDADGIYFVLKLNSKDDNHHAAAISAAIAYASVIGSSDPFLAAGILQLARSMKTTRMNTSTVPTAMIAGKGRFPSPASSRLARACASWSDSTWTR